LLGSRTCLDRGREGGGFLTDLVAGHAKAKWASGDGGVLASRVPAPDRSPGTRSRPRIGPASAQWPSPVTRTRIRSSDRSFAMAGRWGTPVVRVARAGRAATCATFGIHDLSEW